MRLRLKSVEIGDRQTVLEVYDGYRTQSSRAPEGSIEGIPRSARPAWLPGAVAGSVVVDRFRCTPKTQQRRSKRTTSVAVRTELRQEDVWMGMLKSGEVPTRAELARRVGVSRARVSQVLGTPWQP